jgi:2-dehydropantoate 2-reductase
MRILVVGAGGIGGYFGGRLLEAGRDVTFLVRPRRREALGRTGLVIKSPKGDFERADPPLVTADEIAGPYDLVLVSCKGYDLEGAVASFAPAVGPATAILPLLNGMRHLDLLEQRFGPDAVLGGLCLIGATLDPEGRILHINPLHGLVFGERSGARSPRAEAIAAAFAGTRSEVRLSEAILQEMWEKWVFIASSAGITSLMRAPIGDIVAGGGAGIAEGLVAECAAIAAAHGFAPGEAALERTRAAVTQAGSPMTASMFRDIERKGPVEADQIIGDLLSRGDAAASPILATVHAHLKAYEARRAREGAA